MKCPDKALKLTVPARVVSLLSGLLVMLCIAGAPMSVTISQSSIRINGVELRSGPKGDGGRYISLAAAEKVLGKPQDTYKDQDKHSGKFGGHVQLDGLEITPDTTFDSIRGQLEKTGFEITDDQNIISAKKGEITIFTVETTNKIERIEAWCS